MKQNLLGKSGPSQPAPSRCPAELSCCCCCCALQVDHSSRHFIFCSSIFWKSGCVLWDVAEVTLRWSGYLRVRDGATSPQKPPSVFISHQVNITFHALSYFLKLTVSWPCDIQQPKCLSFNSENQDRILILFQPSSNKQEQNKYVLLTSKQTRRALISYFSLICTDCVYMQSFVGQSFEFLVNLDFSPCSPFTCS